MRHSFTRNCCHISMVQVTLEEQRAMREEDSLRKAILLMQNAHDLDHDGHSQAIDDLEEVTKGQAATLDKAITDERTRAMNAEAALASAQKDAAAAAEKRIDQEVKEAS